MTKTLTRISVRVKDADGGLEILHGDSLVDGLLIKPTAGLTPGQALRLRMPMYEGSSDLVEVMGTVEIDGDVALMTGLEFDIDVTRMTRAPTAAPPGLPEGFSELPTLHMPQSAVEQAEPEEAPAPAIADTPREVTMETADMAGLDDDEVFADLDDPFEDEESAIDDESLELTKLEREIAALEEDASELDEALEVLPSGFEEDERQTSRERRPFGLELTDPELRVFAEPYQGHEAPPYNIEPVTDEEPTLDEPTGIVGTLKEMSLCELVQSMEIARKTAQLVISPKGEPSGSVFLKEGIVVWAEHEELLGEEAFYRLGRAFLGSFRMRFHVAAPGRNVDQPTPYLVLEALRRVDEGRASGEIAIPNLDAPALKERLPSAREVVVAAQRAAARSERRRAKTQPPSRPKSTPPTPAEVAEPAPVRAETKTVASEPRPRSPSSSSGSLFSSFFEEADRETDENFLADDDTAFQRVVSSSGDSDVEKKKTLHH